MADILQNIINAASLGSLYALFALGVALIFGVGRIANFANGDLLTVAGYLVAFTATFAWPLAVIISIGCTVVLALFMELAFRPVRRASATTLLIVSFALSALLQNILLLTVTSRPVTTSFGIDLVQPIHIGDVTTTGIDLVTIGVTVVIVAALTLVLRRTTVGLMLRASSEDFLMARLLGVRANGVMAITFAISGVLAALAGIMLTVKVGTLTPTFGVTPVTVAFIAAVLGGLGSLVGAALGGVIVGVITVLLQVLLPPELLPFRDAFVFGAVILLLLWRPQGLLAAPTGERV
jgi:branched-chain amino acid transport system permease protein